MGLEPLWVLFGLGIGFCLGGYMILYTLSDIASTLKMSVEALEEIHFELASIDIEIRKETK